MFLGNTVFFIISGWLKQIQVHSHTSYVDKLQLPLPGLKTNEARCEHPSFSSSDVKIELQGCHEMVRLYMYQCFEHVLNWKYVGQLWMICDHAWDLWLRGPHSLWTMGLYVGWQWREFQSLNGNKKTTKTKQGQKAGVVSRDLPHFKQIWSCHDSLTPVWNE